MMYISPTPASIEGVGRGVGCENYVATQNSRISGADFPYFVKLRTQFFASFFYHFLVSRTTV
jgi:hypothetical protein